MTRTTAAERRLEQIWDEADEIAILPLSGEPSLGDEEMRHIADAFVSIQHRARGRAAAPRSWLPASGPRVATALGMMGGRASDEADWPTLRRMREAFVDLQAFLPDAEADAAEADTAASGSSEASRAALDRVAWAQAIAISFLRDDRNVVGAYNALKDIDIAIGDARRSLEAVDRYKESQAAGMVGIVVWPTSFLIGAAVATIASGLSIVAIASVAFLTLAGFAIGPLFGSAVGRLGSRIDRLGVRSDHRVALATGRVAAAIVSLCLLVGVPFLAGFLLVRSMVTSLQLP